MSSLVTQHTIHHQQVKS